MPRLEQTQNPAHLADLMSRRQQDDRREQVERARVLRRIAEMDEEDRQRLEQRRNEKKPRQRSPGA
jgi:hypothetical protein